MYFFTPEHIRSLLKSVLPGAFAHKKMIPPGRELAVPVDDINSVRYSSVLLLLFPFDEQIYTCLIKRNEAMKNHPGQVSLPGGRIEDGESPELTALREAQEEVGISPDDVCILGRLSELYVQISQYTIFPFVGWMDQKPEFILNRAEAEKLILFPIQKFHKLREVKYTLMETSIGILKVPYFPCEGEIVWGATAMILTEFLELLGEPKLSSPA